MLKFGGALVLLGLLWYFWPFGGSKGAQPPPQQQQTQQQTQPQSQQPQPPPVASERRPDPPADAQANNTPSPSKPAGAKRRTWDDAISAINPRWSGRSAAAGAGVQPADPEPNKSEADDSDPVTKPQRHAQDDPCYPLYPFCPPERDSCWKPAASLPEYCRTRYVFIAPPQSQSHYVGQSVSRCPRESYSPAPPPPPPEEASGSECIPCRDGRGCKTEWGGCRYSVTEQNQMYRETLTYRARHW